MLKDARYSSSPQPMPGTDASDLLDSRLRGNDGVVADPSALASLKKQRGAGLIGTLALLALLGFVAFAGIQIVPAFMQNWVVQRAMTHALTAGMEASDGDIRQKFETDLRTNNIDTVTGRDLVIERTSAGLTLTVVYSVRKPFFGPVDFIMDFESNVPPR